MALFQRRRPAVVSPLHVRSPKSLTAAGFRIKSRDAEVMRRLIQVWQARAFAYYDQVPELKFAAQFYARLLAPLRLYAAEIDENKDVVETSNADAIEALDRVQDPGGGRTGLLSSYGRLMFIAGECYLFVTTDPDTGLEQWEMLSTDELRVMPGTYIRYKAPSLLAETFNAADDRDGVEADEEQFWVPVDDRHAVAYRLWQKHPRFSMLPDATMMGILDVAEELLLLTRAVRARARNRAITAGILFVDERVGPAPSEPEPDEDMTVDPLLGPFIEAIETAIEDEGSASAMAPILVRAKAPEGMTVKDLVYHLQLVDPMEIYPETGLRNECVRRLAIGLDMPPEELLGMSTANHWGSWLIDEKTWKAHGQQKAQQLCDDITSAYLRPYLRDVVGLADWQKYMVGYDASAVITHPDRTSDAKDLHEMGVIGDRAVREVANFDEEDAQTEEERNRWLGIKIRDASLAVYGIPSVKAGGVEPQPGEIVSAQGEASAPVTPTGSADVEKTPPQNGNVQDAQAEGDAARTAALVARVLGASDLALLRAREAAGNRLRSLAKKDATLRDVVDGLRAQDVAPTLGREGVRALRVTPRDLVSAAHDLTVDAFRIYGIDEQVAALIAQTIEQHAARTLYDRHVPNLSDSFAVYVMSLLRNGNGHGP